jgi:hypothetical protein
MAQDKRPAGYRRLVISAAFATGAAAGLAIGGAVVLTGTWWPFVILVISLGVRVVGGLSGRLTAEMATVWLWPLVAIVVALALAAILPKDLGPIVLGLAVAVWFSTMIVAGILDVAIDREGRWG